jgi:hypothetical protein
MPFEQILRDHLLDDAEVVPLPERGDSARAIARARARRRHRLTAAAVATVAVVAAAGVTAVPALTDDPGGDTVITPAATGLDATGPLDLDWSAADGGLSGFQSQFQQADGTVYALSTGPGARYGDPYPLPQALYRLDENGVWQTVALDGDHRMQDVAGVGDTLYGVSTAPAPQGDGMVMHLSRSGDGGETWTDEDIPPADPPSTSHDWGRFVTMKVESNGPTTLALVATQFIPNTDALFPEAVSDPASYMVQPRDDGLALVRFTAEPGADGSTVVRRSPPTTWPADPTTTAPDAWADSRADIQQEDVRIVPWSDLGVGSQAEAYAIINRVFRLSGDTWEPVANDLGGNSVWQLGVAGDLFTAQTSNFAFNADSDELVSEEGLYVSADGSSWTRVEAPRGGQVVGAGSALVSVPSGPGTGTSIDVSTDGGAKWSQVDLAGFGMASNCFFTSAAGGPLGVALVIATEHGPEALATSADLVDWTITPLADLAGTTDISTVTPFVGRDRIVVSVNGHSSGDGQEPGPSRTLVGTPRRS